MKLLKAVCSPILFNIDDIFNQVEHNPVKSLYADDGLCGLEATIYDMRIKKIQAAIVEVKKWKNKQGFKLSVTKTQVICFSGRHRIVAISLKLFGQPLEQVKAVRFFGVWFDVKLTWEVHLDKINDKSKKVINILVYQDWNGEQVDHICKIYTGHS